jgi:hypothetical protein
VARLLPFDHRDVQSFLMLIADLVDELKKIRRALENGEEEEEDLGE